MRHVDLGVERLRPNARRRPRAQVRRRRIGARGRAMPIADADDDEGEDAGCEIAFSQAVGAALLAPPLTSGRG